MGDSEYRQRDLVVQVHATASRRDPPVRTLDETGLRQHRELAFEAARRGGSLGRPQTQHQRLRPRLARVQVFPVCDRVGTGGHVLARARDVPPPPCGRSVGGVRMRAGSGAVDRHASPVGEVVPRLESGLCPVGDLVPVEARRLELAARPSNPCTPRLSRLTPPCSQASSLASSVLPGLASSVTSASGSTSKVERIWLSTIAISSGGSRLGVPPPRYTVRSVPNGRASRA